MRYFRAACRPSLLCEGADRQRVEGGEGLGESSTSTPDGEHFRSKSYSIIMSQVQGLNMA